MSPAPRPARRRVSLAISGLALAAVVFAWLGVARSFDAAATAVVPTANAPIILVGNGSQATDTFYLAGGTYRGNWSAWGEAPEFPPCTHSAELMAVDPANGNTSRGHVTDLAKSVDVPATGASDGSYVYNVKPGDYYVDVTSACAWQIALSPN